MIETGCDIAWEKPTGKQLADAGIRFASLYVGQDDTGKNMTPAVVADYAAHGVWINTNFEYGAQQMLGGAKQGAIDAKLGLAQATACRMPPGRPISYSADWDATTAQINGSIIPYLVAARSVTGPGTVGVYGSYAVVTAVAAYWAKHFPGERIHLWQTVAWSKSAWYAADEVRQPGGTITVGGIAIDLDYADVDDFGQWMPGQLTGADMPLTQADIDAVASAVKDQVTNVQRGVVASPHTGGGTSTVGSEILALPTRFDALNAALADLGAKLTSLAAPVDVATLTAGIVAALTPVVTAAVEAGAAPNYDQMALAVEAHLSAALGQAK